MGALNAVRRIVPLSWTLGITRRSSSVEKGLSMAGFAGGMKISRLAIVVTLGSFPAVAFLYSARLTIDEGNRMAHKTVA